MSNASRIRTIFNQAIELAGEERAAFIASECGDDADMRRRVELLIEAAEKNDAFLSSPTSNSSGSDASPTADVNAEAVARMVASIREGPGEKIGPYTLIELIGEGGFGSVFKAQQHQPISRQVALKIIKLGMDTRQVIARFEQERQALAMMDHANVAKVLDAGCTHTGRPFFVMELVQGEPIVEYCDRRTLPISQRLELFAQICKAVQHAHSKGIIHRDIKPSNVLVTTQDDKPLVKVIDFGIAKATAHTLTEKTLFTDFNQLIGTPEYMSPEQAEGNPDIDTRTDVYSLGVLLYELLTGTTPFSRRELRSAAYGELQRIIREVEPPHPSARLSHNASTLASVAARRQAPPQRLGQIIRGELDWIVMKSLEKDRSRRYDTPASLGLDVERYLTGEPVAAAPPSKAYRARKFINRHRAAVVTSSIVAAALVLGLLGTAVGMMQARHAAIAERAAKLEAQAKHLEAERNLSFAKKGNQILGSVFASLNPDASYQSVGELRAALRSNLDKAVADLDGTTIGTPLEVSSMQQTLGLSLLGLGEAQKATEVLRRAVESRSSTLGTQAAETLEAKVSLASAMHAAGKRTESIALRREVLDARRSLLGPDHVLTLDAMQSLAWTLASASKVEEGLGLAREVLRLTQASTATPKPDPLGAEIDLASILQMAGRYEEALPLEQEACRRIEAMYGPADPRTLAQKASLALCYQNLNRFDMSIPLWEERLTDQRRRLGREHPATLITLGNLAVAYQAIGKPDAAMLLYEETYTLRLAIQGPEHPNTIGALSHLIIACANAGQHDRQITLLEELVRVNTKVFGPDHRDTIDAIARLGRAYSAAGRTQDAERLRMQQVPPNPPR